MWKWQIEASVQTKAKPEKIWHLWADVAGWPKWDRELEWSELEGPFAVGTSGKLKPKDWKISAFRLSDVQYLKSFMTDSPMPFTRFRFHHTITTEKNGQVKITHWVEVCGLLAPILRWKLGKKLRDGLSTSVQILAKLAEIE